MLLIEPFVRRRARTEAPDERPTGTRTDPDVTDVRDRHIVTGALRDRLRFLEIVQIDDGAGAAASPSGSRNRRQPNISVGVQCEGAFDGVVQLGDVRHLDRTVKGRVAFDLQAASGDEAAVGADRQSVINALCRAEDTKVRPLHEQSGRIL